jgi:hypothetical protein
VYSGAGTLMVLGDGLKTLKTVETVLARNRLRIEPVDVSGQSSRAEKFRARQLANQKVSGL